MAEIRVKLLAEAHDLIQDTQNAVKGIEEQPAAIRIQADTGAFLDAVKRAVEEAEKLQPIIQISAGDARQQSKSDASPRSSQSDPNKAFVDQLKLLQNQSAKNNEALKKSIDELTRAMTRSKRRPGDGGGGGQPDSDSDNNRMSWKSALLQYMNIKPNEDGQVGMKEVLGGLTGGGDLMGLLSSIPGMGKLLGMLSIGGITSAISNAVKKDAGYNRESRSDAASSILESYNTFGSVMAYDADKNGDMSYFSGAYNAMRLGEQYGYDMDTVLSASDSLMSKAGFSNTEALNADITSVVQASRATGVDTSSIAALTGTATQLGYQENGDQGKILSLLGRQIEVSGMQGREDEMVDVLESILDELGAVNGTISEEAVGDKLNLMNLLTANNENLNGDRAKSAIDSIEDFTGSNDMSVMIAAGYGTEYTGKEGWMKLRQMQEENPTEFMERVIRGFKDRGMSQTDIAFMLDKNGVGSTLMNQEVINAVYSGDSLVADMTDTAANRRSGGAYYNQRLRDYEQSGTGTYVSSLYTDEINANINGADDLRKYRNWQAEMRNADAETRKSEGKWKNALGDNRYEVGKYDLSMENISQGLDDTGWNTASSDGFEAGTPVASDMSVASAGTAGSPLSRLSYGTQGLDDTGWNTASSGGFEAGTPVASDMSVASAKTAGNPLSRLSYGTQGLFSWIGSGMGTGSALGSGNTGIPRFSTSLDNTYAEFDTDAMPAGQPVSREASLQLRKRQEEENPTEYTRRTIETLRERGMSETDAAFFLDQKGIGSSAANEERLRGVYSDGTSGQTSGSSAYNTRLIWDLNNDAGLNGTTQPDDTPISGRGQQQNWETALSKCVGALIPIAGIAQIIGELSGMDNNLLQDTTAELSPGTVEKSMGDMLQTGADDEFLDALSKNTEELKKNTLALTGEEAKWGSYFLTGSQQQSALAVGEQNALGRSLSIQSPLSKMQQTNPSLFKAVTGITSIVRNATNSIAESLENKDAASSTATVSSAEKTVTAKGADGSLTVSGPLTPAVPTAVGNDYVPYDGYLASLHRGEAVLRRDEAELFRQGRLNGMEADTGGEESDLQTPISETRIPDEAETVPQPGPGTDLSLLNEMPVPGLDTSGNSQRHYFPDAENGADGFLQSILAAPSRSVQPSDININIRVSGQVEGMNRDMQQQMVEAVQAQIAGAGLRDLVANGFTRRQNW